MPAYFFQIALRRIPITPDLDEKLVVCHADLLTRPRGHFSSGAFLGGHDGEGGPALFNVFAAAMRALNFALLVVNEGKNLVEEFVAVLAEKFVVGHGGPPTV